MTCPRCGSGSILQAHGSISCLPCGHVLQDVARQPWDMVSAGAATGRAPGPAWTADERRAWADDAARR